MPTVEEQWKEELYRQEGDLKVAGPELKPSKDKSSGPRRTSRLMDAFVAVGGLFVIVGLVWGGLFLVRVLGGPEKAPGIGQAPAPSQAPVGAPPEQEKTLGTGLAQALAHVVATEPDVDVGVPRMQAMLQQFREITLCNVTSVPIETSTTRAEAQEFLGKLPNAAMEKIHYAEKDWEQRFVIVGVELSCG